MLTIVIIVYIVIEVASNRGLLGIECFSVNLYVRLNLRNVLRYSFRGRAVMEGISVKILRISETMENIIGGRVMTNYNIHPWSLCMTHCHW